MQSSDCFNNHKCPRRSETSLVFPGLHLSKTQNCWFHRTGLTVLRICISLSYTGPEFLKEQKNKDGKSYLPINTTCPMSQRYNSHITQIVKKGRMTGVYASSRNMCDVALVILTLMLMLTFAYTKLHRYSVRNKHAQLPDPGAKP